MPHIGIGDNCVIENAIIDKNCRIGNNVTLTPGGETNADITNPELYVRDGILVTPKGVTIPDGWKNA